MEWPIEIQVALVGAALAAVGYVGKMLVEWWQDMRRERASTIAQLQSLRSLLKASRELFLLQKEQVKKLMEMLKQNHPREFEGHVGYEDAIARCHTVMDEPEQELRDVIRAYTEHSLRKLNQAMSDWLSADTVFKMAVAPISRRRELAEELFALEIHLTLWHAKFESWIPNRPEHALVYLNDENKHGLGFPNERVVTGAEGEKIQKRGIDREISDALAELQKKWE